MSETIPSLKEIILDWEANLPGRRFDSRKSADALDNLISALKEYGFTKKMLLSRREFLDPAVNVICRAYTAKQQKHKRATAHCLETAIAAAFPIEKIQPMSEEERIKREALATDVADSEPAFEHTDKPDDTTPTFMAPPRVRKQMDLSKFADIQTTPVDEKALLDEIWTSENE